MPTDAAHPSAAPLDLDALERLATKAKTCGCRTMFDCEHDKAFIDTCSPDVILALVAAARRGVEDTARIDWLERNIVDYDWADALYGLKAWTVREVVDAARAALPTEDADA